MVAAANFLTLCTCGVLAKLLQHVLFDHRSFTLLLHLLNFNNYFFFLLQHCNATQEKKNLHLKKKTGIYNNDSEVNKISRKTQFALNGVSLNAGKKLWKGTSENFRK